MNKSTRIYRPTSIWVIRYGGLSADPDAAPICITTTIRHSAVDIILPRIADLLERKYPREIWFEDIIDHKGKLKFRKESVINPRIFVEVERTPFCDGTPTLPEINLLKGGNNYAEDLCH